MRVWVLTLGLLATSPSWAESCPDVLQGQLPKLRAKESIDLCQRFKGKPLVVVNTASYCGFAPQFKGLEALYQRYKGQGLEMVGVPSDDFKQEAKDSEETAKVCYANYGVTFTMTEPQVVKGPDAVHLFQVLARQSSAPTWNFYKYVIDRQGQVIEHFPSVTKPDDPRFVQAVEKAIASTP